MTDRVYIPPGQRCEARTSRRIKAGKKKGNWRKGRFERRPCGKAAVKLVDYRYFCAAHGPAQGKYAIDPYYRTKAWRELRSLVLQRDGGVCRYCGSKAHQADHVMPRSRGGPDRLENLVACCAPCNRAARAAVFPSFEEKRAWILTARKLVNPIPVQPAPKRRQRVGSYRPANPKSLFKQKLAARVRAKEAVDGQA